MIQECSANYFSTFPVAQQVIGAVTVLSNLAKLVGDVVQKLFYHLARRTDSEAFKQNSQSLNRHGEYVIIGFIRMIPGLGTDLSKFLLREDLKVLGEGIRDLEEAARNPGHSTEELNRKAVSLFNKQIGAKTEMQKAIVARIAYLEKTKC